MCYYGHRGAARRVSTFDETALWCTIYGNGGGTPYIFAVLCDSGGWRWSVVGDGAFHNAVGRAVEANYGLCPVAECVEVGRVAGVQAFTLAIDAYALTADVIGIFHDAALIVRIAI